MFDVYAVIPDPDAKPAAGFTNLEDALDWGLRRFGSDKFRIRFIRLAQVDGEGPRAGLS